MKQWSVSKLNRENAKIISRDFNLPPIIAALLDIRGFTRAEDINSFLFNDTILDDPFELKDMDKAADRIKSAVESGERICVYGDYDADGVTSTALLYSYLQTAGADVIYYIPDREAEGYGMHIQAIDSLKDKNVRLIVTVDNGISASSEIAYASSLGMDTVVTDHHMPGEALPQAVAVVDPHRPDCGSNFKMISGVGVAFKLVLAIEGEYADSATLLDNYSDLVSIGTIGDIVPLVSENRVFVKRGLNNINNSDRPGVIAILRESGLFGKSVTCGNVSFTIVPRINAVGRLGLSQSCVELLLTEDESKASEIACKLGEDNARRQAIEKEILQSINRMIAQNPALVQDKVIIIDGEDWHRGVIGIVSARIKDAYAKPCIVLSKSGEVCRGSGRSVEGFDLWEAVNACSHLLTQYGGHPMAVGLGLDSDKIPLFRKAINDYASTKGEMPYDKLKIDCKLNPAFLDVELAKQLTYMQPFGAGNPTPVFQLSAMTIEAITPLSNNKHLKIRFKNGDTRVDGMYFSCSTFEFPYVIGDTVDLAVAVEVNLYKNNEYLSVIIKDIKFTGVDNTVYIRSLRTFESFCKGLNIPKEELASIIPDRSDFAYVYMYLKRRVNTDRLDISIMLHRIGGSLTYGKAKVILEAMNELGLIDIYEDMHSTRVRLSNVDAKVNLEDSLIISRLKEVYENG